MIITFSLLICAPIQKLLCCQACAWTLLKGTGKKDCVQISFGGISQMLDY